MRLRALDAALLLACSCGSQATAPVDAGRDSSSDVVPPDAQVDAATRPQDAAIDSLPDAGPRDAAADADPNVYPCETRDDCALWWRIPVPCVNGFCCEGDEVDGACICGERAGTCPPMLSCCTTRESTEVKVCINGRLCYTPGGF